MGLPGDTLEIANGVLYVNGVDQDDLFGLKADDTTNMGKVVVGEGKAFIMGDNRKQSYDSRHFGQIRWEEIVSSEL